MNTSPMMGCVRTGRATWSGSALAGWFAPAVRSAGRLLLVAVWLGGLGSAAQAEKTLLQLDWGALQAAGKLHAGTVLPAKDQTPALLEVRRSEAEAATVTAVTLEKPPVSEARYLLRGRVRYEGLERDGYLELLSYFEKSGPFFTRTLNKSGPLGKLAGSSDWRSFALPFIVSDSQVGAPIRLVLNVHMDGPGVVWLREVELVEYARGERMPGYSSAGAAGAWWSASQAGWIGAFIGVVFGLGGALIGVLAARGRARTLVLSLLAAALVVGVASCITGIVALLLGQPYAVYYPLLLVGVLAVPLACLMMPEIRRRYAAFEMQRMAAQDLS